MFEERPFNPSTCSDFYTWIWWKARNGEAKFDVPRLGEVKVMLEERLAFRQSISNKLMAVFTSESLNDTPPALKVLQMGRQIQEVKLRAVYDDMEFVFTLKGGGLDLSGVKLPLAVEGTDPDDIILVRLMALERLDKIITGVLGLFVEERLSSHWESTELGMSNWVENDSDG